jgi:hypothetical protein
MELRSGQGVHALVQQEVATMTLKQVCAGALLSSLLAGTFVTTAFAQAASKWFVLRNHELGTCWTATLVRIDGQFTSTFEQKAGGPYDTEQKALERLQSLSDEGTCNRD